MTLWTTPSEAEALKAAEKEREEHQKQLDREIETACRGDVETVTANRGRLEAERVQLQEDHRLASWRQENKASDSAEAQEYRRISRRLQDVGVIIGAVDRGLSRLREERSRSRAQTWAASTETRQLYQAFVEAKAAELEPLANLIASYESLTRGGGVPASMMLLPAPDAREYFGFIDFVAKCRRSGLKVDLGKLPAVIRDRIEAAPR